MVFQQLNIPASNYSTTGKEHGMFENVFFTIIFPQLKMLSSNCKSDSMQHKSISKKHEIYEKVLMSVIIFPLFKQGLLPCAAKYPTIVCLMVLKSQGYCQCMSSQLYLVWFLVIGHNHTDFDWQEISGTKNIRQTKIK